MYRSLVYVREVYLATSTFYGQKSEKQNFLFKFSRRRKYNTVSAERIHAIWLDVVKHVVYSVGARQQ
jgi:hypothetical protein